ncbi:MAG TPA: PAS-domain containing protein, partial [Caulobacteraceae bacterium]
MDSAKARPERRGLFRIPGGGKADAVETGLAAFDTCLIAIDGEEVRLIAGQDSYQAFAGAFTAPDPAALLARLVGLDSVVEARLAALRARGDAFAVDVLSPAGGLRLEGRTAGALALVKLSRLLAAAAPAAERFAAFVDTRPEPAWIADGAARPVWVNRAWLMAVGADSLDAAKARGLSLDGEADRIVRDVAASGEARATLRWMALAGARRALRFRAAPIEGGDVAVWSDDVTEAETAAERLGSLETAQEAMLGQVADAIAVFGPDRRLSFHNAAFARLWDLEPAWLADRPGHGELLDRLRQRGRLPEHGDFNRFKAAELARHEGLGPAPEVIWRLPGQRSLKVASQPHPRGGLLMVFSDVTPELRLRSQFNHLLQVQQATLDKLSDAVAVFGADGRLRLHNEAFERFWSAAAGQLAAGLEFDKVVELAQHRLHDLQFWRDLKARISDPDPAARAPMQAEIVTADRRIVAHQSRPLPDGAMLLSFADITDTRRLERALADREAALSETERLKREFVGSVSYELRTPLTTILGYAELLEHEGRELDPRARGHLASIRAAAAHLARSINNVLAMAQFDAGEVAPDMADVDVAALMGEAAARWEGAGREQGVGVEAVLDATLGLMRADPARLAEVLDHLMENALRHTPAGGS